MSTFNENQHSRQSAGTSIGGQFANREHVENFGVSLGGLEPAEPSREDYYRQEQGRAYLDYAREEQEKEYEAHLLEEREKAFVAKAEETLGELGWKPDYDDYDKERSRLVEAQRDSGQVGDISNHSLQYGYGRHLSRSKIIAMEERGELVDWAEKTRAKFGDWVGRNRDELIADGTGVLCAIDTTDFLLRASEDRAATYPDYISGEDKRLTHYLTIAAATVEAVEAKGDRFAMGVFKQRTHDDIEAMY